MNGRPPIAVALDTSAVEQAVAWAHAVAPHVSVLKVGLQLYLSIGQAGVREVQAAAPECEVFLDLKLHDIPNTVKGATAAVADLVPKFLTVHAAGGREMISAAVQEAPAVDIAAVTILTSLSEQDLQEVGFQDNATDAVRRLAGIAVSAGARALVCSPMEVALVRDEVGPDVTLITPGVRPATSASDDQARVATPEGALAAGSDLLVIGRPITGVGDPATAAKTIAAGLPLP
jgi:orotidine-5'-phosphate decarboxylase